MSPEYRFSKSMTALAAVALALAAGACKQVPAEGQNASALASLDNSTMPAGTEMASCLPPEAPEADADVPCDSLPPVTEEAYGGEAPQQRTAPAAEALPAAPQPIEYAPAPEADAYSYVDQAYWTADTIGDAPPDYSYAYDDADPWAWETADDSYYYAEPIDGGWRNYYYAAGATVPYLIRDPWNSYGYDNGRLVAVYDSYGRYVPVNGWAPRRDFASRYYWRAQQLRRAAVVRERRAIFANRWAERRSDLAWQRTRWAQAVARDNRWQAYHQRVADRQRARWADERVLRVAEARRFDRWREAGFRGDRPRLEQVAQREIRENRLIAQRARAEERQRLAWRERREDAQDQRGLAEARQRQQQQAQQQRLQDRQRDARLDQRADRQREIAEAQRQTADRQQREQQQAQQQREAERRATAQREQAQREQSRRQQNERDQAARQQAERQQAERRQAESNRAQAEQQRAAAQRQREQRTEARREPRPAAQPERQANARADGDRRADRRADQPRRERAAAPPERRQVTERATPRAERSQAVERAQRAERPRVAERSAARPQRAAPQREARAAAPQREARAPRAERPAAQSRAPQRVARADGPRGGRGER